MASVKPTCSSSSSSVQQRSVVTLLQAPAGLQTAQVARVQRLCGGGCCLCGGG